VVLTSHLPRHRLDAGTLATMGIGVGYAIAAAISQPHKVVCVQGDSAFGFSGMEVEVACRYGLPITFVVINNNGIYRGLDELPAGKAATVIPPTALTPNAHYERLIEAFGGKGYFVTTPSELDAALRDALQQTDMPTLITVMIRTDTPTPAIVQNEASH